VVGTGHGCVPQPVPSVGGFGGQGGHVCHVVRISRSACCVPAAAPKRPRASDVPPPLR
jgi:hypothetical protein